ncbi:unnamed protein product [Penicillium olsonii]|nr:unnamed protein product [Penicillium olsonii]
MITRSSPTRGRIAAPKSRSGCKTCKVKCGEEKPKCLRCTSTGRKCDFETDVPSASPLKSASLAPTYAISSSPGSGHRERRAFEYYFQHAAQYLSGGMNINFWTGIVPQICRTEPAIWDAIIAISSLFEYPVQTSHFTFLGPQNQDPALHQAQKEALTWYSRSISGIHAQIDRGTADPYVSLVTCVLFICVETIQGRMEEALKLLQQGFSLIHDLRSKAFHTFVSYTKVALLEDTIIPLFLRLNTVALNMSGTHASPLFVFEKSTEYELSCLDSARNKITTLAAECMLFQREAEMHLREVVDQASVDSRFYATQNNLKARLDHWLFAFTKFCQVPEHELSSALGKPAVCEPILLIYHAAAYILVATCLTRHQSVYDDYLDRFQTIVHYSSMALDTLAKPNGAPPPFTFEMGVGLPLYLTALKCRHPSLRRKALQLSKQGPLVQGFYKCLPGIALVEHLMALEESYSAQSAQVMDQSDLRASNSIVSTDDTDSPLDLAALVPEEDRICDAGVFRPQNGIPYDVSEADVTKWNCRPEQIFISFRRLRYQNDSGTWVIVHDCIPMNF